MDNLRVNHPFLFFLLQADIFKRNSPSSANSLFLSFFITGEVFFAPSPSQEIGCPLVRANGHREGSACRVWNASKKRKEDLTPLEESSVWPGGERKKRGGGEKEPFFACFYLGQASPPSVLCSQAATF